MKIWPVWRPMGSWRSRLIVSIVFGIVIGTAAPVHADLKFHCPICGSTGHTSSYHEKRGGENARRNTQSVAPSQDQPSHPHVHTTSDGKPQPDDGYLWAYLDSEHDYSVIYAPNCHRSDGAVVPNDGYYFTESDPNVYSVSRETFRLPSRYDPAETVLREMVRNAAGEKGVERYDAQAGQIKRAIANYKKFGDLTAILIANRREPDLFKKILERLEQEAISEMRSKILSQLKTARKQVGNTYGWGVIENAQTRKEREDKLYVIRVQEVWLAEVTQSALNEAGKMIYDIPFEVKDYNAVTLRLTWPGNVETPVHWRPSAAMDQLRDILDGNFVLPAR